MSIDLEAVRRKLAKLQGKSGRDRLWKPKEPGTFKIRLVPIPQAVKECGLPILERQFYYNFGKTVQAPVQFGEADPVAEVLADFQAGGDNSMWKHLAPKARDFAAVIVRGEEDEGVRLWSLNKETSTRILSFFMNDEIGDVSDPQLGFDLDVMFEKRPLENGKSWLKPTIDATRKPSKLAKTQAQIDEWVASVPNIDEVYPKLSYGELEQLLKRWLGSFEPSDEGTEHTTAQPSSSVDNTTAEDKLSQAFNGLDDLVS